MWKDETARRLALYVKEPIDGIEIGGVSDQLLDIVKSVTRGDNRLRRCVLDWLNYYCDDEDEFEKFRNEYDRVFLNGN